MDERMILLKFIKVAELFKPDPNASMEETTEKLYNLIEVVREKLKTLDKHTHPTGHGEQGWK